MQLQEGSDDERTAVINIPNFDKEIFGKMTGIKITKQKTNTPTT